MDRIYQSATVVRSNFSDTIDKAIYDRPQFINRTKDVTLLVGAELLNSILSSSVIHYSAHYDKKDKIYVITNTEIEDIIASGDSLEEAETDLAASLLEYAHEYYDEFGLYSRTPNRKGHLPFVIRLLSLDNVDKVKEMLVCQNGKS